MLGGTTTLTSLSSDTGQPLGLDQDQLHGPDQSQPSVPDQDLPPGPAQDQAPGPDQAPEPEQAPAKQERTQAVAKDLGIPRDKAVCFLAMSTCAGRDNNLNFPEFRRQRLEQSLLCLTDGQNKVMNTTVLIYCLISYRNANASIFQ